MREAILGYIKAVEANIETYKQIKDPEERQRALDAAYGMKTDFERVLETL